MNSRTRFTASELRASARYTGSERAPPQSPRDNGESLPILSANHGSHLARDIEATTRFYVDVLGFQSTPRPELSVKGYWLVHHEAGFQFHLLDGQPPARTDDGFCLYHDHLCFVVRDLQHADQLLERHGVSKHEVTVDMHGVEQGRIVRIIFADPDLNIIVLVQDEGDQDAPTSQENSEREKPSPVPLASFVYLAFSTADLERSLTFYSGVLGFRVMEHALSWLDLDIVHLCHPSAGIELHLIPGALRPQVSDASMADEAFRKRPIHPVDDHISFYVRSEDIPRARALLDAKGVRYIAGELPGAGVQQLFFHDPDGHMLEICTCEEAIEQFQPAKEYTERKRVADEQLKERLKGKELLIHRSAPASRASSAAD